MTNKAAIDVGHALKRLLDRYNESRPIPHIGIITRYEPNEELTIELRDIDDDEAISLSFSEDLLILTYDNYHTHSGPNNEIIEEDTYEVGEAVILIPVVGKYLVMRVKDSP